MQALRARLVEGRLHTRPSPEKFRRVTASTLAYSCALTEPRVRGEFIKSRGNRRLVQPATALLPAIRQSLSTQVRQNPGGGLVTPVCSQNLLSRKISILRGACPDVKDRALSGWR